MMCFISPTANTLAVCSTAACRRERDQSHQETSADPTADNRGTKHKCGTPPHGVVSKQLP